MLKIKPQLVGFTTQFSTVQIAWIKVDTKAILAIHDHVITNNARLTVTMNDKVTWTLHIRNAQRADRGFYMCQINTEPMAKQVNHDIKSWRFVQVIEADNCNKL